jgi:hypothetical protein
MSGRVKHAVSNGALLNYSVLRYLSRNVAVNISRTNRSSRIDESCIINNAEQVSENWG